MGRPTPFILLTIVVVFGIFLLQGGEAHMCGRPCWGPNKCKGICSQCTFFNKYRAVGSCQKPLTSPAPPN
uniref:Putative secreted protein n=1 Tax=Ixodes ricinus TaxID=34613 RepID=A0A6B0TX76_IXORI